MNVTEMYESLLNFSLSLLMLDIMHTGGGSRGTETSQYVGDQQSVRVLGIEQLQHW